MIGTRQHNPYISELYPEIFVTKIPVRAAAVARALTALALRQDQLAITGMLTISVYVDRRLTPESFPPRTQQGAVILRFTRQQLTDQWQLDDSQFTVLRWV